MPPSPYERGEFRYSSKGGDPGGMFGAFGGTTAPQANDYIRAAEETARSNQLGANANSSNIFGAGVTHGIGPDGRPIVSQSMGGPMGAGAQGIMGMFGSAYGGGNPFNFTGPGIMGGEQARDQAISGAYNQATSRLDPQWQQREEQQRTQLLNQGLDPQSEAYKNSMGQLGQQRNDAYSSAMNNAIGQGTAAGDSMFRNSLMGSNAEYDRQRQQYQDPMQMAQALGSFTGQPGFNATAGTDYSSAALNQDQARFRDWDSFNKNQGSFWGGFTDLATAPLQWLAGRK